MKQTFPSALYRRDLLWNEAIGKNTSAIPYSGESIADLGGLSIAWNAWQRSLRGKARPPVIDGFSPEQRFFFACAQGRAANLRPELVRREVTTDTHPIPHLRVNGPLSNMPEFAAAFGCHTGDPMMRAERCKIW
ncbi:MAG TPA: M13-type metalloendopeptidase [Thermoanaerobaculia bacterium]|nr:M13-type metalloendopeptidase [Thermoanaerobaculia bacterium]